MALPIYADVEVMGDVEVNGDVEVKEDLVVGNVLNIDGEVITKKLTALNGVMLAQYDEQNKSANIIINKTNEVDITKVILRILNFILSFEEQKYILNVKINNEEQNILSLEYDADTEKYKLNLQKDLETINVECDDLNSEKITTSTIEANTIITTYEDDYLLKLILPKDDSDHPRMEIIDKDGTILTTKYLLWSPNISTVEAFVYNIESNNNLDVYKGEYVPLSNMQSININLAKKYNVYYSNNCQETYCSFCAQLDRNTEYSIKLSDLDPNLNISNCMYNGNCYILIGEKQANQSKLQLEAKTVTAGGYTTDILIFKYNISGTETSTAFQCRVFLELKKW